MIALTDTNLGTLEMTCGSGYVVTSFDIGAPEYRVVTRNRALADGADDDTQYIGTRAVTVGLRIDQRVADPQLLIDRLSRYQNVRRRPSIEWSIPGSTIVRSLQGLSPRGLPLPISGPKYHSLVLQWEAPHGKIESPDEQCVILYPSEDVEVGRTYPESYVDGGRGPYPFSPGVGSRIVHNEGDELADWRLAIYGPAVNPEFRINGISVNFNRNGGLTLLAGEYVLIDTRHHVILLNGNPADSRYNRTNFTQWSWSSLLMREADNLVRIAAVSGDVSAQFCWRSAFLT